MPEQEYTHSGLTIHGRHVPEPEADVDLSAYDTDAPVTGVYEIGVDIDGVFVPIFAEKASKILTMVERKQTAGARVEPDSTAAPEPPTPSEREQELQRQLDEYQRREAERGQQPTGQ
jgi:hypothetical protein